jgi:hypothetical protein
MNPTGVSGTISYGQFAGQLPVQPAQNMVPSPNLHPQFSPQSNQQQSQQQQQQQQQQPQQVVQQSNFMTPQQRQLALQQMMQHQQQRNLVAGSPRRAQQIFAPQAIPMQQFYPSPSHPNAQNSRGQQYLQQQAPMPPLGQNMQRPTQVPQHPVGIGHGKPQVPQQGPSQPQLPQQGLLQPQQIPPPMPTQLQPTITQNPLATPPPQGNIQASPQQQQQQQQYAPVDSVQQDQSQLPSPAEKAQLSPQQLSAPQP